MLHILYSALALCSPCYLSNDFSLSLKIFSFLFYPPSLTLHLPFTILSPPLSTSLYSHISPPLLSPCLTATCFFPNSCSTFRCCFFPHSLALTPLYTFFPLPLVSLSLFLRVISQVDWPLNIIITDSCMNKYNRLFSFLLQLKHMVWSLREVWFHLKRTGERVEAFDPGPTRSPPHCKEGRVKILPVVLQRL